MMSHRYRLYPTPDQEPVLERHSADARYVWNLALEQVNFGREQRDGKWRDKEGLGPRPGPAARQRQLAEARQGTWLAEGSSSVQQQALRDFDRALANWRGKTHRRPRWRKKGEDEGFCVRDVHREAPEPTLGDCWCPQGGYGPVPPVEAPAGKDRHGPGHP